MAVYETQDQEGRTWIVDTMAGTRTRVIEKDGQKYQTDEIISFAPPERRAEHYEALISGEVYGTGSLREVHGADFIPPTATTYNPPVAIQEVPYSGETDEHAESGVSVAPVTEWVIPEIDTDPLIYTGEGPFKPGEWPEQKNLPYTGEGPYLSGQWPESTISPAETIPEPSTKVEPRDNWGGVEGASNPAEWFMGGGANPFRGMFGEPDPYEGPQVDVGVQPSDVGAESWDEPLGAMTDMLGGILPVMGSMMAMMPMLMMLQMMNTLKDED